MFIVLIFSPLCVSPNTSTPLSDRGEISSLEGGLRWVILAL